MKMINIVNLHCLEPGGRVFDFRKAVFRPMWKINCHVHFHLLNNLDVCKYLLNYIIRLILLFIYSSLIQIMRYVLVALLKEFWYFKNSIIINAYKLGLYEIKYVFWSLFSLAFARGFTFAKIGYSAIPQEPWIFPELKSAFQSSDFWFNF